MIAQSEFFVYDNENDYIIIILSIMLFADYLAILLTSNYTGLSRVILISWDQFCLRQINSVLQYLYIPR